MVVGILLVHQEMVFLVLEAVAVMTEMSLLVAARRLLADVVRSLKLVLDQLELERILNEQRRRL